MSSTFKQTLGSCFSLLNMFRPYHLPSQLWGSSKTPRLTTTCSCSPRHFTDLQNKGLTDTLSFEESSDGPDHLRVWTVQCKSESWFSPRRRGECWYVYTVSGVVKGTGRAGKISDAKHLAATQALAVRIIKWMFCVFHWPCSFMSCLIGTQSRRIK